MTCLYAEAQPQKNCMLDIEPDEPDKCILEGNVCCLNVINVIHVLLDTHQVHNRLCTSVPHVHVCGTQWYPVWALKDLAVDAPNIQTTCIQCLKHCLVCACV